MPDSEPWPGESGDEGDLDQQPPPYLQEDTRSRRAQDVLIAVMGVTGAGKSSFIQLCTGQKVPVNVGHGIESCTQKVEEFPFTHKDSNNRSITVRLIDTPGFDDTNRGDAEVLKDIATWLSTTYEEKVLLSGVLYLHRIIDVRMTGSAKRNLLMFRELCGPECYQNVVLSTTMWSQVGQGLGDAREAELVQKFWGDMKSQGSIVVRHKGDKKSALSIIDQIVKKRKKITLRIQHEIVEKGKNLNQTAAGQQLDHDILEERKRHMKDMEALTQNMNNAIRQNDAEAKAHIAEIKKDLQTKIEEGDKARESIRASYEKMQKEREEELKQIKDKINDQVKELEKRTADRDDAQRNLDQGQGNPAQLERYLERYERKITELEEKMKTQKAAAERRSGGIPAEIGKSYLSKESVNIPT